MTEKELHKLRREDLLQLLLAQGRENINLENQIEKLKNDLALVQQNNGRLKERLDDKDSRYERLKNRLNDKDVTIQRLKQLIRQERKVREIHLSQAGDLASASLAVAGIYEMAQKAADDYLYNLHLLVESGELDLSSYHPVTPGLVVNPKALENRETKVQEKPEEPAEDPLNMITEGAVASDTADLYWSAPLIEPEKQEEAQNAEEKPETEAPEVSEAEEGKEPETAETSAPAEEKEESEKTEVSEDENAGDPEEAAGTEEKPEAVDPEAPEAAESVTGAEEAETQENTGADELAEESETLSNEEAPDAKKKYGEAAEPEILEESETPEGMSSSEDFEMSLSELVSGEPEEDLTEAEKNEIEQNAESIFQKILQGFKH